MEMFSKSKDIFFSNFDKICRTCIKTITEPLHHIFDSEIVILNESIKTYELLIAVSTLKMHPDDDLPKAICIQCLDSLTKAYNFQKMCILSDLCMRSAIIPHQLEISLEKHPLTNPLHNNQQSDNCIIFDPSIENLITQSENSNSIKIVYSEPLNTGIENIGHSDQSIVSKPIIKGELLTSEDINAMRIVFLPPESDLIQHSGSRLIIPNEINNHIEILSHVPASIGHVEHLGPSLVIPSEINSNMNIFPSELPLIGHVDSSGEAILLEPSMKSAVLSNEPPVDFTNVPPWKRGTQFQTITTKIEEPCVQSILMPSGNKEIINIFPTESALSCPEDHLNATNVSELSIHNMKISIDEENCKEILTIETAPLVSDPVHSNEIEITKENNACSILQSSNILSPEIDTIHSEETTILPECSDGYKKSNACNDLDSTKCDINNSDQKNAIQIKEMTNHDYHHDTSGIILPAESHSTESNIEPSDLVNVKNIRPASANEDDYHDDDSDDDKTKVLVDAEDDLINKDVVSNKKTKKEVPFSNTPPESEESNNESMDQNSIDKDIKIEMENPEPGVQEIEKPDSRTKKNAYFTCETCGKTFDREHRLHRHMNLHKKEGRPFECEYCRRRFAQEANLQRHFITHEKTFLDMIEAKQNVDGYQCPECPRKFVKQESLASHMKTHRKKIDASKRFKCEICPKVFESLYRLTRHKQLHEGNRKYNCEICGKTFGLSSHLVDHLNMHSGIKPHVCDYCQKSFQQACTLRDHLRTHTGEQPYLCSECGKTFNNSSNLRQHLLRHSGIKRYQCPECPSKFTCKSGLFSHTTTHRNHKPYVCKTCGSRFTKNYSLKKHERIHTGERPYKCDYCEMRFNSSDHMKRHMRTHTGEKPYKCKYCEKNFAQSNDMIKHLRSHVGKNVYKCEECDASFRLNTELKKHISEHYQAQVRDKTKTKISKKNRFG